MGGMIFIRDNPSLDFHRLPLPPGIFATVVYPHVKIVTKDARAVLKEQVSFENSNRQTSNLAGLIIGLFRTDLDLIQRSLKDDLVEEQRAHLIPGFYDVKAAAIESGVLGCSISGAGPSVFALSANSLIAEEAGQKMQAAFSNAGIQSALYISKINQEGAILY
jgi:homoserine kinase